MILTNLLVPILAAITAVGVSATPVPEPESLVNVNGTSPSLDGRAIAKRSFLNTCLGPWPAPGYPAHFTLTSGHILNANCLLPTSNPAGGVYHWNPTTLDLNNCITNSNGNLQWWNSGIYKWTCPNAGLRHTEIDGEAIDQVYLWADCYNGAGQLKRSEIRLNDRIHNWSGLLFCQP